MFGQSLLSCVGIPIPAQMIRGISVLEKETTADKYIKRKLQTVTASRHLTGFDVDI